VTLHIHIPGGDRLELETLVLDVNGTLSDRGEPITGVVDQLRRLEGSLALHLVTADTFGTGAKLADSVGALFERVENAEEKVAYLNGLGATRCVAVGNGRNDWLMLAAAALGIVVIGPEGAHGAAITAADVVVRSIGEALALLADPRVLTATLRP
jgi:soluble P-type ATPase